MKKKAMMQNGKLKKSGYAVISQTLPPDRYFLTHVSWLATRIAVKIDNTNHTANNPLSLLYGNR